MTTVLAQASDNFLLPNATFFVELILFVIILLVLHRFVVPPLSRAMAEREQMVKRQVEDREEAARKLRQAEERYETALHEARGEAAKIRDEARADAQGYREELRARADEEVERIRQRGEEYLTAQREQTVRQLRDDIGGLSTELAERIVGESLPGDERTRSTVDSFLSDLDERTPTGRGSS